MAKSDAKGELDTSVRHIPSSKTFHYHRYRLVATVLEYVLPRSVNVWRDNFSKSEYSTLRIEAVAGCEGPLRRHCSPKKSPVVSVARSMSSSSTTSTLPRSTKYLHGYVVQ